MSDFIWYWSKGNSKVYTKDTDEAERAMKKGILVMGKKIRPNIIKYWYLVKKWFRGGLFFNHKFFRGQLY